MLSVSKHRALQDLYQNLSNPASYGGVKSLYREAVQNGIDVSIRDVKSFLESNPTYTIFRPTKKRFKRSKIFTIGIDDTWMADLFFVDRSKYANSFFIGFLAVIDTFSDFVWTRGIKRKNTLEILDAFKNIMITSKRKPTLLVTDGKLSLLF